MMMAEADNPVPTPRAPTSDAAIEADSKAATLAQPLVSSFALVLSAARRRLWAFALLEAMCAAVTGAACGLVLALVVVGAAPFSLPLRLALLALIGAGALAGLWFGVHKAQALRHDLVIGARLEDALLRRGLDARDAVRAAVELRSQRDDAALGRSRALADAHVEATATRVRAGNALASLPAVALERAVPLLSLQAVVAFVIVAWSLGATASFAERWQRLFDEGGVQRALEQQQVSLLPLVTDLKITLRFPAYMAEPDEIIPGSSGDVAAPRGSEVIIEGRTDRPVERASLLMAANSSTQGATEIAGAVKDGRTVMGTFVVDVAGSYRFKVDGALAGVALDPVAHKITVQVDAAPSVSLEEPSLDRTVKLDDPVDLAFFARDDVGLTKMRVVVKRQGSAREPYVKDLIEVPGALREARGTGAFDVAATGARPGDKLSVYIEALDNDSVSGPNIGRSQTRVLTVYSAAQQHRTVIERLEDVMSRMVDSLGDELEAPLPKSLTLEEARRTLERHDSIGGRHAQTHKSLEDALLALAEDEMSPLPTRRALANMKLKVARVFEAKSSALQALVALVARGLSPSGAALPRLAAAQAAIVERLEQDILYLEDLLNRQRIAQARQLAADLKRAQEDLKALLSQFKQSGDEATRTALLEEIQRMRKQVGELMERLAKLQHDIPDEYLNQEAFKGDEMLSQAKDIDKLIEEGKLEEAAAQLDKMLASTQKLVDDLDKTGEEYGGDEYQELREKLQRFSDELSALGEGQRTALDQAQAMLDKAKKQAEQRLKGKLDQALTEVKKQVERAKAELDKVSERPALQGGEAEDAAFARARIEDLQRALDSKDLDDATGAAEEAEAAARSAERSVTDRTRGDFGKKDKATLAQRQSLEAARRELEAARKQLQDLLGDPRQQMDNSDKQKLAKTADQQQQLEENARSLEKMMEEIGKEAPVFGPEHKERLGAAREAMRRAGGEMRSQNLRAARSSQRQALRALSELGKDLAQMGQGSGGGMPLPLPRGGSPGAEDGEQEGDGRRPSKEDVKIPDAGEFKVPDAFRKDILDAMREGVPDSWQGEVKRYYEKLIK